MEPKHLPGNHVDHRPAGSVRPRAAQIAMSRRTTGGAPEAVEASEWRNRKHVCRRCAGGSRFLKAAAAFLPLFKSGCRLPTAFVPRPARGTTAVPPPLYQRWPFCGPSEANAIFERSAAGYCVYIYIFIYLYLIFIACSLSRIMIDQTRQISIWRFNSTFQSTVTVIETRRVRSLKYTHIYIIYLHIHTYWGKNSSRTDIHNCNADLWHKDLQVLFNNRIKVKHCDKTKKANVNNRVSRIFGEIGFPSYF